MSNAISAHGTLVSHQPTPAGAFTTIAELFEITPPPLTRPSTEVTPHNDTIDGYVVGVKKRGEMTLVLNFLQTNATHDHLTGLVKSWIDGSLDGFTLTFQDTTTWIYSGFITNVAAITPGREGAQTANITIRPSGAMKIGATTIS
jgi:hypothetical protein